MKKDLVVIVLGRVYQIVIMLATVRLLTTVLSEEEIGNYYLATAFLSLFNLVLLNPFGMYFTRKVWSWKNSGNLANGMFCYSVLTLIFSFFSIPVIYVAFEVMGYADRFDILFFSLFIMLAMTVSASHRTALYAINTLGGRIKFTLYLVSTLSLGLFLSFLITIYYEPMALGWLFGVIFAELMVLLFIFKSFVGNHQFSFSNVLKHVSFNRVKGILKFCIPIGITTLCMWGQNTSYRFIVDYRYSAETLGYIAVGVGVATAIFSAIESIVMQYLTPIFLKKINDADKCSRAQSWCNLASIATPIFIVTFVFVVTLSNALVIVLVDEKFHGVYIFTIAAAFGEFFRVMTNMLICVSQSEFNTKKTIIPYMLGALVVMLSLLFFDFGNELYMIPAILSAGYFVVFLTMYYEMKTILDVKIVINMRRILSILPVFAFSYYLPTNLSLLSAFFSILVFGIYYLFTVWFLVKEPYRS